MHKYYNDLLEAGKIKSDKAQAMMVTRLDDLKTAIIHYSRKRKILGPKPPAGIFIHGKVGRGKSMLMDGFFSVLPIAEKRRVHFHEFMQGVHSKLHEARSHKSKTQKDIVAEVAKDFTRGLKVLCFDEFEVTDVTDAMLLSKLFKTMSDEGVVFVITSNKPPAEHYKDGLQRESYLEFCAFLQTVVNVQSLDAKQDFRLSQKASAENYFSPINYENTQRLKEKIKSLTTKKFTETQLKVKSREIKIHAAGKIAHASFAQLCGENLGAADYLAIAKIFDVLVLGAIPQMREENRNEARRFINLIDILYENKIVLLATAAAEPDRLYTEASSGEFEFRRTASRLTEMRGWSPNVKNQKSHVSKT